MNAFASDKAILTLCKAFAPNTMAFRKWAKDHLTVTVASMMIDEIKGYTANDLQSYSPRYEVTRAAFDKVRTMARAVGYQS